MNETSKHRIGWSEVGWDCSCGAGNVWPLASPVRGRVAAYAHLRAAERRNRAVVAR